MPRARSARTRPPARGVRVCAFRAHVLTPFASFVLSLFFRALSPAWTRPHALCVFVLFLFERISPLAGVAPSFRLSSAFRLLLKPFIPHPFGRRARLLISDCEGLRVMHGTRFAFTIPPSHTSSLTHKLETASSSNSSCSLPPSTYPFLSLSLSC